MPYRQYSFSCFSLFFLNDLLRGKCYGGTVLTSQKLIVNQSNVGKVILILGTPNILIIAIILFYVQYYYRQSCLIQIIIIIIMIIVALRRRDKDNKFLSVFNFFNIIFAIDEVIVTSHENHFFLNLVTM